MVYVRKVALIILTDKKKVLLQHRDSSAPRLPDHWAFFGGGIEEGETPLQAVKRETFEEIEYILKNPTLVLTTHENKEPKAYIFTEEYDSTQLVLHEGDQFGWFSIDEAKNLKMSENDRKVLAAIASKGDI